MSKKYRYLLEVIHKIHTKITLKITLFFFPIFLVLLCAPILQTAEAPTEQKNSADQSYNVRTKTAQLLLATHKSTYTSQTTDTCPQHMYAGTKRVATQLTHSINCLAGDLLVLGTCCCCCHCCFPLQPIPDQDTAKTQEDLHDLSDIESHDIQDTIQLSCAALETTSLALYLAIKGIFTGCYGAGYYMQNDALTTCLQKDIRKRLDTLVPSPFSTHTPSEPLISAIHDQIITTQPTIPPAYDTPAITPPLLPAHREKQAHNLRVIPHTTSVLIQNTETSESQLSEITEEEAAILLDKNNNQTQETDFY